MSSADEALKARSYNRLASSIRELQFNLKDTEDNMAKLSDFVLEMRGFAAANAAQFMAVSTLLDCELKATGPPQAQNHAQDDAGPHDDQ